MAGSFRRFKTQLKYGTIHRLLDLGKIIPVDKVRGTSRVTATILNAMFPIRTKVRKTMAQALGEDKVSPGADRAYFDKIATWGAYAMQIYHNGLVGAGIPDWMVFDDSVHNLEEALAQGKGVIYATPHLTAHEITAGVMALKYPTVGLVRESKYPAHQAVKRHYYEVAGGCPVIFRPRRGSVTSDMRICTRSLKEGNILVITPDLLVDPDSGVSIQLLGRTIQLRPGIITLAMATGAPVVNASLRWEKDRVLIHCDRPRNYARSGDLKDTVTKGMQEWCDTFSEYLQKDPSSWQFWLDRQWIRVWQNA